MLIDGRHLAGAVVLVVIFVLWYAIRREWKEFNRGYCSCGGEWRLFDRDSQGGRGYKCSTCDQTIWISYSCVDGIK